MFIPVFYISGTESEKAYLKRVMDAAAEHQSNIPSQMVSLLKAKPTYFAETIYKFLL